MAAGDGDPASAVSSFYETVENDPYRWLTVTDDFAALSPDWVSALGRKGGRTARYNCWLAPSYWYERAGLAPDQCPVSCGRVQNPARRGP